MLTVVVYDSMVSKISSYSNSVEKNDEIYQKISIGNILLLSIVLRYELNITLTKILHFLLVNMKLISVNII